MKVCVLPTGLTPFGVIEIRASTQHFVASEPAGVGFVQSVGVGFATVVVERCNDTPNTNTVVLAFTSSTPAVADVSVTVHEPVPPAVVHGEPLIVPGPLTFETAHDVPAGAFTKPAPEPSFTSI